MAKANKEKMEIEIGASIEAATGRFLLEFRKAVATMSNAGMDLETIKETLKKQINLGTGAFGGLKKDLRTIVAAGVGEAANKAMYAEYRNAGIKKYRWITVSAKPCPDCLERHGQVDTLEGWEAAGLPKSGFSVCQEICKCRLVPEEYKGQGLDKPVIRRLKSPKGQAYAQYREIDIVEYVSLARETAVTARRAGIKSRKHPEFAGDMSYRERVDWVREQPDGVYFQLHKNKKQVVFVRGDYYVFSEDKEFKTGYIPAPEKLDEYRDAQITTWIRIPEGKWKTRTKKNE